jgi:hypothetical protein
VTNKDLPLLGVTPAGQLILGGFFTAHDTHGFHCDWFMAMFLEAGYCASVPYFAAECLQHRDRDPEMIWPMLEGAYREARLPWDGAAQRERLVQYLAVIWQQLGKPSLQVVARHIMAEQRKNGEAARKWLAHV